MADQAHDHAKVFVGGDGKFYFTVYAGNGEPISQSEGYSRRIDATATLAEHFPGVRIVEEDARP